MRVCMFTDSFLPYCSGGTFAVLNQARELAQRGHDVWVFRPRPWRDCTRDQVPEAVQVHESSFSLPVPHVPQLYVALPSVWSAIRKLAAIKPDVIHVHTEWGCGWEGLLGAKLLGIPSVGTFHTFFADPEYLKSMWLPKHRILQTALWQYSVFAFSRCSAVTSPSQAADEALLAHGLRHAPVRVSNGIAPVSLRPPEEIRGLRAQHLLQGPTFVYVGRLSSEKSLDVLLQSFHAVVGQRPDARLVLIGEGPERLRLQWLIRHLGLETHVVQLGPIPHDDLLASNLPRVGDVFVTASKTENQPLSVLEALAFGLPVVGVNARGMPELVTDGMNGLLCPPDDPAALARGMLRLVHDQGLWHRLSQAARASVADHTITRTVDQLEQAYRFAIRCDTYRRTQRGAVPDQADAP